MGFCKQSKDTAKGYTESSVKLPTNTPPNNTPVSDAEARNTSLKSIQKSVKSNNFQNLVGNIKDYGKDGEKVSKEISYSAQKLRDNLLNIKDGKTLLERPEDLYKLGFLQYFDPQTLKRYYYMYGYLNMNMLIKIILFIEKKKINTRRI